MATVKQYRFFEYGSPDNYAGGEESKTVTYNSLVGGQLFFYDSYTSAKQLGIQTMPGTKFYLGNRDKDYSIIVGKTGIYELNSDSLGIAITELCFDGESIEAINSNPNGYLIVDIIYSE